MGQITPEKHPARKEAVGKLKIKEIPKKAKPKRKISIGTPTGPSRRSKARQSTTSKRVQSKNQRPLKK
jgi:hypothetical protein